MKKIIFAFFIFFIFSTIPVSAKTTPPAPVQSLATWKPATPSGYTAIVWAKAPGIASFFKTPNGSGTLDFLTRIYLPQNQIGFFIASSSMPADGGVVISETIPSTTTTNFFLPGLEETDLTVTDNTTSTQAMSGYHNFAFARVIAEVAKSIAPTAQFIWNGPFFNITRPVSDLSMALKMSVGTTTLITSGSRPATDMAQERRMIIIDNQTARASIKIFDPVIFASSSIGDQAFEGFAPTVIKTDSANQATARLFLGVSTSSKELVVFCSRQSTVQEASDALVAAGVPVENQLEADGGGSATCGYNLPGQFFVEPMRTLPLLMGATTVLARGVVTTNDLNVRSGPAAKYSIIIKLPKGQAVKVFEEKNGWLRIGDGQWVLKTLIKKTSL